MRPTGQLGPVSTSSRGGDDLLAGHPRSSRNDVGARGLTTVRCIERPPVTDDHDRRLATNAILRMTARPAMTKGRHRDRDRRHGPHHLPFIIGEHSGGHGKSPAGGDPTWSSLERLSTTISKLGAALDQHSANLGPALDHRSGAVHGGRSTETVKTAVAHPIAMGTIGDAYVSYRALSMYR